MVKVNKKTKVFLSLLLAIMMILGSFTSLTYAENVKLSTVEDELKEVSLQKIESEVLEDFKNEEYAEVLVYMKEQTDTQMIAETTKKAVSSSLTPYKAKIEIRKDVVESLKDTAEKTQVDILKYLEQEREKGNVLEYEPYYIVNMIYLKATKEVVERISYLGEVEKIYKNKFHEIEEPIKNEINIESIEEDLEWNIEKIGANLVWNMGIEGRGITIGLIDTGATWDHPALKEKWRGYDVVTGTTNPKGNWFDAVIGGDMPYDIPESPHGSHVLGTILGQEPDGSNKIGVAPGAKWIAAKAFTAGGGQDRWLISAGQWMLAPGGDETKAPDIINNSWGGQAGIDDWYRDIVKSWRAAGILPVFAAGNQKIGEPIPWPGSIQNPANYPESFAVSATDVNNKRGSFSKLGPSPYDETMIKPNISAPGLNIRSSVSDGYEGGWDGTSMAAPHIAGTAALLLSADSSLTVDQIEYIIENTATPLTDSTYLESPNFGYGYGLVNAYDAVLTTTGKGTVRGKVLIEGEDIEGPTITHNQEVMETYYGSQIEIIANVSDDISIIETELLVKAQDKSNWVLIPMNRLSGDHKYGEYKGIIDSDLIGEPGLIYKIRARDYVGNIVYTEDYQVGVNFGIVPDEYETNFDICPVDWELNGDWQWGKPIEGIGPAPHSGTNLVGTILDGKYSNRSDSYLITPPIDLRDETIETATFRFYHWYEMEKGYDKGQIYITTDYGENWVPIGPIYTGDQKEWKEEVINLEQYIGTLNQIFIAYRFTSDASGVRDGWYIDDVRLVETDNEAPAAPIGFESQAMLNGIHLTWDDSPEGDLAGYKVYRSEVSGRDYVEIGHGLSTLFVDTEVESGKTYYYVITAVDFSGNESEYSDEINATALNVTNLFTSNFENDDGGFVPGGKNNSWEWGVPTSGPNAALTGTKVWATNLSGNHLSNSDCVIIGPDIEIPNDKNAILLFDHWYDTEGQYYDYGQVHVSKDGGTTWTNITPQSGGKFAGHKKRWEKAEIPLEGYSGERIKLRFRFVSNNGLNFDGWYIDNISVIGVDKNNDEKTATPIIVGKSISEKYDLTEENYKESREFDFRLNRGETEDKAKDYKFIEDEIVQLSIKGVPVDAVVTILETGKSVRTNLTTGEYEIKHVANEKDKMWTLHAEAYGYYPQELKINLNDGDIIEKNFKLEPVPKGNIVGQVVDRHSKRPAPNAVIRIKEDPRIAPVIADENGVFKIESVYEGEYTLKVMADEFEPGELKITVLSNQDNECQLGLRRFVGYEEEIGYDDGTAENALTLNSSGSGFAVRITPERYGKVKGANIFFWDNSWPTPGGSEIGIAIFDTKANGEPGNMIGDPKIVAVERGKWNTINLSDYDFATDRDFLIATVQTQEGKLSPGVGIDKSCKESWRSYSHVDGHGFTTIGKQDVEGGLMIRGAMEYSVSTPKITNLQEINYTNQDKVVVEGVAGADGKINVYVNGDKVEEVETEDKAFLVEVDLNEEENIIMVTLELNEKETEPSNPVIVVMDKKSPALNVNKPIDGEMINVEVVHVVGNVFDEFLDKVLINDIEVELDENGDFHERLIVNEGENIISIKAIDLAGNMTQDTRKVVAKLGGVVVDNIEPSEDIVLMTDDVLKVRFKSETGGIGRFRVVPNIDISNSSNTWISMRESEQELGLYEGIWTIPEGFTILNGLIEIEFTNSVGSMVLELAAGTITVEKEKVDDPDPTVGEAMETLPTNTVIVGDEAFDIRYLNNNQGAQKKLIEWYGKGNEIYIKLGKDTIVNIRGEIVGIEALPYELTYYDAGGETTVYIKID